MGEASQYWICKYCVDKKGLIPPDHDVTVIQGFCRYCLSGESVTLTPVSDYKDPKSRKESMWD